jgi:hypothetical protein
VRQQARLRKIEDLSFHGLLEGNHGPFQKKAKV